MALALPNLLPHLVATRGPAAGPVFTAGRLPRRCGSSILTTARGRGLLDPQPAVVAATEDCGLGICALDVKVATIAAGLFLEHASGTTYPAAPLADEEVMHGGVRVLTWSAAGGLAQVLRVPLRPNIKALVGPRGGFGVCGVKLADVLPSAGDELLVTTMAGDFFIFAMPSGAVLFRTHVPGAAGMYGSIVVADRSGDGLQEIYLAGSYGVYRFAQAGDLLASP